MGEGSKHGARDHGGFWVSVFVLVASFAFASREPAHAQGASACTPAIARVVSLQGEVEVQRGALGAWSSVRQLDTAICAGDRLRARRLSRAALFVLPETLVRLDENTTISLRQSADETHIELHVVEPTADVKESQCCGAVYLITRFPKKFKVTTPHMNAAVEGTEFIVESSRDASKLTVLEGTVSSESVKSKDRQLVSAGQSLSTGGAGPGPVTTIVKPEDAVQWTLRYPPIRDQADSVGILEAETLLRAGSVDEALDAIDTVLASAASDSDAYALKSIIQIAKNDSSSAMESAGRATEAESGNYRGWLALSYAQQAALDLDAALASARTAQSLRADSALAHARVAELHLSLGDTKRAEQAARAAIAADRAESHAHSMLGFVHLAQIATKEARIDFEAAILRDSFSALPRLGLGLAKIRDGELVAGREELEVAVALDPSNSLLRSYVGKGYYEENTPQRDMLAATQYELAAALDPRDPTPNFYDAVLRQSQNRPVAALDALKTAASKNDNRAVYRSRLLIDDDAAAQGATIAAVYGDLELERLGINASTQALAENMSNASAHRELAAAYANLPRHDIARVSEALQAQMRQPVSIAPVPPVLATDSMLVLKDVGPAQLGAQEFNQLFNGNGFEATAETLVGSRDTLGGQLSLSGLANRVAYSVSAVEYETDGFIENDAAEKAVYNLFVQGQLQPGSTVQVDIKRSDIEVGQTFVAFNPASSIPTIISERSDAFRLSGHGTATPKVDWIWTAVYEDRTRSITSFPDQEFLTGNDSDTYAVEVQNLLRIGDWQVVSGLGYVDEQDAFPDEIDVSITTGNLYAYGQWQSRSKTLALQMGFSVDLFEIDFSFLEEPIDEDKFNPRIGLVWQPRAGTTVRAAAASTLKRPLIRSQTIEPTQVAGFNQYFTGFEMFFGDPVGAISERIGLAVDQTFSRGVKAGVEASSRDLEVPELFGPDVNWDERSALVYLYKTFAAGAWEGSVSLDAEYEEIQRPPLDTGAEGILNLETTRIPLALRLFSLRGMTIRAAATYVRQKGRFTQQPGEPIFPKDDEAVIADFSFEYALPRRKGAILAGVNNAFDDFVDLVEIDPLNPRVATRQLAYVRVRFEF